MCSWFTALLALLLPSVTALATPPPTKPRTTCTATLCFDISPLPIAVSSRHIPDTGHVTTIVQAAPGVILAIVSTPAEHTNDGGPALNSKFQWHKRSAQLASASACLNCDETGTWPKQWVGLAVSARSPDELQSFLATATVRLRALELIGFYAETSPALRLSEPVNAFSENRRFGEWQW